MAPETSIKTIDTGHANNNGNSNGHVSHPPDTLLTLPDPQYTEIRKFLSFFSPDPREIFTFALLSWDSTDAIPGWGTIHATSDQVCQPSYLRSGTLHVCLLSTDMKGRRIPNMVSPFVYCVDLDRGISRDEIKSIVAWAKPGMVVESSPGKYHLYWKCSATVSRESWSWCQLALAGAFSADRTMCQVQKTIRVPGVARVCKNGEVWVPEIVYLAADAGGKAQTVEEMKESFSEAYESLDACHAKALEAIRAERAELKEAVRRMRDAATCAGSVDASAGGRNNALFMQVKGWVASLEYDTSPELDDAITQARAINRLFTVALDDREVLQVARSAWTRGLGLREARQERVDAILDGGTPSVSRGAGTVEVSHGGTAGGTVVPRGTEPNVPESHHTNGHAVEHARDTGEFQYRFGLGDGEIPPRERYTDLGIVARILQRFPGWLLQVGEQLWAFDEKCSTWNTQDRQYHPLIHGMVGQVTTDCIAEPEFVQEFGLTAEGAPSAGKIRKAMAMFSSEPFYARITRMLFNSDTVPTSEARDFDAESSWLYCQNGVIDLRHAPLSGLVVRKVCAEDRLLRQIRAPWVAGEVDYSWWENFVREIFQDAADPVGAVNLLQEVFGYSLSGSIDAQKVVVHTGSGSNGKSTVLDALLLLCGAYGTTIEDDMLVSSKRGFGGSAFERVGAKVEGRRVVVIPDVRSDAVWNEGFIKLLTGETLRARAEYQRSREIPNRATLHFAANEIPAVQSNNEGLIRRLLIIPYEHQFPQSVAAAKRIALGIRDNLPGILRWSVEGYQRWLKQGGFTELESSRVALEEYREQNFREADILGTLFEKCTQAEEIDANWHWMSDLVEDVNRYSEGESLGVQMTPTKLGILLKRGMGVIPAKKWCSEKKYGKKGCFIKLKFERQNGMGSL